MTMAFGTDHDNDAESEAERQADAMKDRLRQDVASWSAARHGTATRHVSDFGVAKAPQPSSQPARTVKKPTAATPEAKPATKSGKPFSMSYGGTTTADNVRYVRERGGR